MNEPIPEFELVELVGGEVGEPVEIETPTGTIRATWLGVVGDNGWDLTQAMQLMADMERERRGEAPLE